MSAQERRIPTPSGDEGARGDASGATGGVPSTPFLDAALRRAGEHPQRREKDQEVPAGPRALQTRARLVEAARDLFIEQGYAHTSASDVARRADASLGTFYQYFTHVSDVLGVLILEHAVALLDQSQLPAAERREPTLEASLEAFITSYVASASLGAVWEEASNMDDQAAGLRRDIVRAITGSAKDDLLAAAAAGHIAPFADAREATLVARALTAMVDRFCYLTYIFDPAPDAPSPAEAARILSRLWINSVRGGGPRPAPPPNPAPHEDHPS